MADTFTVEQVVKNEPWTGRDNTPMQTTELVLNADGVTLPLTFKLHGQAKYDAPKPGDSLYGELDENAKGGPKFIPRRREEGQQATMAQPQQSGNVPPITTTGNGAGSVTSDVDPERRSIERQTAAKIAGRIVESMGPDQNALREGNFRPQFRRLTDDIHSAIRGSDQDIAF